MDALAGKLREQHYSRSHARGILNVTGKFSRFLRGKIGSAAQIDRGLLDGFLAELAAEGRFDNARTALRHVLAELRDRDVQVPDGGSDGWRPPRTQAGRRLRRAGAETLLLEAYEAHLRRVYGLAATTSAARRRTAARFMRWSQEQLGEQPLAALNGSHILDFVTEAVRQYPSKSGRTHLCSDLRSFLRYLELEGHVGDALHRTIPKTAGWQLDTLPRHLAWNHVQALLDSIDTCSAEGQRDKAILLLIAILGLRAGEVCTLELGHIDWDVGELRVRHTKSRRERVLPLPHAVGAALADYVLHARPQFPLPHVFVRHSPPWGPLRTNSIVHIVRRRLQSAGIRVARGGAHLLRHSLATRMVNTGVPIKTIADVLGHADIDTTAIYTKVDTSSLAPTALPFPEVPHERL
jgi:site-specific recombinase XerD